MENKQKITEIIFNKKLIFYCPLGESYYVARVTVRITPDKKLFDFVEIEKYFEEIKWRKLIIEDAVNNIFNYIDSIFAPKGLDVTIQAESDVHFPVTVRKTK